MSSTQIWWAALITIGVLVVYEVALAMGQRANASHLARPMHARLRQEWLAVLSQTPGSELLAVQTIRNSLMSATMTASTAVLGLMGSVTLAAPTLHATLSGVLDVHEVSTRVMLMLVLIALLFASLVASIMAVRYYNHISFICAMPVQSDVREQWAGAGSSYVRRAGLLYSWGLRQLVLIAPILAAIIHPLAGPVSAVCVVAVLFVFDRFKL